MRVLTPQEAGLVDAAIFFAVSSSGVIAFATPSTVGLAAIWLAVFVGAAVAAWKGAALSRQIIAHRTSAARAARDGGLTGFSFAMAYFVLSAGCEAQAAGGHYDGVSVLSFEFAYRLAAMSVMLYFPASIAAGAIGACYAVAFYHLNQRLLGESAISS